VVFFMASLPVAFVSTIAAVACWFLAWPMQIVLNRNRPADADDWF
jgi:hypothetical protein